MDNALEYKKYLGTVNYAAEDKVFYGKIEGINDLVTFEGENVSDLEKHFQEAVDDYIHTCEVLEKAPERTYKGVFNVRVPVAMHKQISRIAIKKRMKLNEVVKMSLEYLLTHEDQVLKSY